MNLKLVKMPRLDPHSPRADPADLAYGGRVAWVAGAAHRFIVADAHNMAEHHATARFVVLTIFRLIRFKFTSHYPL